MALHVRYFEDRFGHIAWPPNSDTPLPKSLFCPECGCRQPYEEREANTLPELDRLQARLTDAARHRDQTQWQADSDRMAAARRSVYDRIMARIQSSSTTEYEKDFLREYLKLREERRAKYHSRFLCDRVYLEAREFDRPRDPAELLKENVDTSPDQPVRSEDLR